MLHVTYQKYQNFRTVEVGHYTQEEESSITEEGTKKVFAITVLVLRKKEKQKLSFSFTQNSKDEERKCQNPSMNAKQQYDH